MKKQLPLFPQVAQSTVETLEAYVPGRSSIVGMKDPIKLSSNENPFGASPKALEAFALDHKLHRYPDGGAVALREAIGNTYSLDPDRIVCGVGSDELITLLCMLYAKEGDEVLYSEHGFLMYPISAKMVGATPVTAEEVDLTFSVDNILAKVSEKTKLVFIANPNNPTGSYISNDEMKRLRDGLPDFVVLVIDAAYAEFVTEADYDAGVKLVDAYENVVMTRTFSKIYGLGGLRVGWCYGSQGIVEALNRIRSPFNLSNVAQKVGEYAVSDTEFVEKSVAHNTAEKLRLSQAITELGYKVYPSVANFILVEFGTAEKAASVNEQLIEKGIIVRAVTAYALPSCLRITIGLANENDAVIAALAP